MLKTNCFQHSARKTNTPLVCFGCGKYGHKKEGCLSERQHEQKEPEMESVATIGGDDIENGKSKKYGNRDTNQPGNYR